MSRQIEIRGETSDWYNLAIFELKEDVHQSDLPKDLVHYAEQLVEKSLKLNQFTNKVKTTQKANTKESHYKWIDYFFWTSIMVLVGLGISYVLL